MRWLGRTILALLAVVALAVPALWVGRDVVPPRLARWAINLAAGAEVVDDLGFRIEELSFRHLTVADLSVNSDRALTAERVRLDFEPAELLHGRLATATVTGPVLAARIGPSGTPGFGSLDAAIAAFSGAPARPDARPALRRLELDDARLKLAGGAEGWLRLEGSLELAAGGASADLPWRLDLRTTADGPLPEGVAVAAEGRASVEAGGGARVGIVIADGSLVRGRLAVTGLRGTGGLTRPAAGPLELTAELSAAQATAGEALLPAPYLHLRADPSGLSATARIGPEGDPALEIAAVADPGGDGAGRPFRIDGWADLEWLDAALAAWGDRAALRTRGTAHAELAGRLPGDAAAAEAIWEGTVASGGVTIVVAGTGLPAPASGTGFGSARLAVALAAGRLAVETAAPATFDTDLAAPLPGPVGDLLGSGRTHIELGAAQAPFRVLLADPFGTATASLAGPVRLAAGHGAAAADGSALLSRGDDGVWSLRRIERAAVTARGIAGGAMELHELDARIEGLELGPDGPRTEFEADVRMSAPGHGVAGAAVAMAGRIESDASGSRLLLTAPARLSAERLAPVASLAPVTGLAATVEAGGAPVASRPAGGGPVVVRLPLDLPALRLASAAPGAWGIALQPMRLLAEATVETDGTAVVRARTSGGSAEVTPAEVTLAGLAADLRLDAGADGIRLQRLDLRARQVADKARLARFVPLSLEGSARGAATPAAPDRVSFRATLRGADGAFVLDAEGQHRPSTGRGEARLTLFPIRFVPGGLQPADLSPAAAALFRDASGEISLGGRVRWPGEAVPPDDPLTLVLRDLGFSGSLGTVTGLGGSVALSRIDPPATPPGQTISAAAIDVGVPIAAPRIRFRLEPAGILRLEAVDARFADGRVTASDVEVPLDGKRPVPVVLTVEGVDAARLAEAVDLEGLAATGTLSGWLPLLWDPEAGLAVRQARLSTGGSGGSIQYRPKDGAPALQDSGEQVSLLLKAIRNFVYESFEVEADGRPGEPFDVRLRLRGANPDLYDGYPIALNVTLTGAFDQLFGNLRRSLGLTDVIRRRLEATTGGG